MLLISFGMLMLILLKLLHFAMVALHDVDVHIPLLRMPDPVENLANSIADEFLVQYPRKTVNELNLSSEDGFFIVLAQISSFVDDEKWWYPSCRCHKSVTLEDGLYFCGSCATFVLGVTPRFRVKIEVSDGEDVASFVIFDSEFQHLIKKECKDLVLCYKSISSETFPEEFLPLIGRQFLFKVQKTAEHGSHYDDSYKIKNICSEVSVIETFKDVDEVKTPQKMIKNGKFPELAVGTSHVSPSVLSDTSEISEITPSVVCLDDIPFGEDPGLSSSSTIRTVASVSTSNPAKRTRRSVVKVEKE